MVVFSVFASFCGYLIHLQSSCWCFVVLVLDTTHHTSHMMVRCLQHSIGTVIIATELVNAEYLMQ